MSDVLDIDGTNVTASHILEAHHKVVGERDKEGYLDNCERCGYAVGWVQPTILGPDHWGHATQATSDEVRGWIARNQFRGGTMSCATCGEPIEPTGESWGGFRHILADSTTGASQDDNHIAEPTSSEEER